MIIQLGRAHEAALRPFLASDPVVNLFLLGFLDAHGMAGALWYARVRPELDACALVVPGRLVVPFATDPAGAAAIGKHLRGRFPASMVIGPREASDALWTAWTHGDVDPVAFYDQRLYRSDAPTSGPVPEGLRRATLGDAAVLSEYAADMEREDLGRDPRDTDPEAHREAVRGRILRGSTWVVEDGDSLCFTVNVGTASARGSQVGGTYVPPHRRGEGWATRGMRGVVRRLLSEYPYVTLHVNERNTPAVRAYERAGFHPVAPFRLIAP